MRQIVKDFAKQMEANLLLNDDKGGWDGCNISWLFSRLEDEVQELKEKLLDQSANDAMYECADVANFAMMLWDNLKYQKK